MVSTRVTFDMEMLASNAGTTTQFSSLRYCLTNAWSSSIFEPNPWSITL